MQRQSWYLNFNSMQLRISLFIFLTHLSLIGQEVRKDVNDQSSFIQYEGKHLLHDWDGINQKVKGIAVVDEATDEIVKIALLANVRDFDSNNSSRDAHALEVLEALQYPEIKFYSDEIKYNSKTVRFSGSLEFHGISITQSIEADLSKTELGTELLGEFQLIPSDFGIELPSFLSVKMKDLLRINYRIVIDK
jgi:polyisoprenoid-binding protein YceI|tara:strand:+ start:825 stop:1400 length:576 start_codon:yes stop_codon:yes gene_type:complete